MFFFLQCIIIQVPHVKRPLLLEVASLSLRGLTGRYAPVNRSEATRDISGRSLKRQTQRSQRTCQVSRRMDILTWK